ncbi:hypothetical protein [Novosphingobium sp.]|uniref:hypothetical protein n=1 Tax=Novosphingobium sp. TaxID=1874826 RepID=UPI00286DC324|nr:hypothetical protein [Novosphingobium sp.]
MIGAVRKVVRFTTKIVEYELPFENSFSGATLMFCVGLAIQTAILAGILWLVNALIAFVAPEARVREMLSENIWPVAIGMLVALYVIGYFVGMRRELSGPIWVKKSGGDND